MGSARHSLRMRLTCGVWGRPAAAKSCFMVVLSMPVAEPRTPEPTYAISASSKRPWMVPSSPKVPWRTGKMTSRVLDRAPFCWARSALAVSWRALVCLIGAGFASPDRRCWASVDVSHWPCLVMAMGTTSYFFLSMALRMLAAERKIGRAHV